MAKRPWSTVKHAHIGGVRPVSATYVPDFGVERRPDRLRFVVQ